MFISHCHVGVVGFGLEKTNPEIGILPALLKILDAAGVEGAVVFAPFPSPGLGWPKEAAEEFGDPNWWLQEQLAQHPRLAGFACINPGDPDAAERLKVAVGAGMVGAKIHPPVQRFTVNDPAIDPFFAAAEALGVPVHIHTGVHGGRLRTYMPLLLDDVCQAHPNLSVIMDHLGGYAFFDQAIAVLHNNKNCYVGLTQCSGRDPRYAVPPDRIDLLLRTVGPERIVYGFDYPWNKDNEQALKDDIAWVESWRIPAADKELILGGNIRRLVGRAADG